MRIGLYGGCFNPVHAGHLAAARGACNALDLDRLIFIPSGNPPLKGNTGLVEGAHRLAMIELAVADDVRMGVSSIEIEREGLSYTVDTVRALRTSFHQSTELFFLLGDDCLARLSHWKGIEELNSMLRFAILPRQQDVSGSTDKGLIWLHLPRVTVSSTQIRSALAEGQAPVPTLLPQNVLRYITDHSLYGFCPELAHG